MKRAFSAFILASIIIPLFLGWTSRASASAPAGINPALQNQGIGNVFTFGQLGYTERVMLGPYDSTNILFSVPPTWQLQEGSKIVLRYNFSSSGGSQSLLGANLLVYYNNVILDTIYLNQGGQVTREIAIPLSALQSNTEDGRNIISLFFDASLSCEDYDFNSNLVISAQSEVQFAFAEIPPVIDLSKLPSPIYQPSPLERVPAVIVVPDQPSALELQAAMAVSAGLGSSTFGDLEMEFAAVGNLSDVQRLSNNLIFVGLPSKFSILQGVNLPIPLSANGISLNGVNENDGIMQMSVSPWNPARVLMLISGNTEQALVKASAIFGSDNIFTSGRPDLVIISDVNKNTAVASVPDTRLFSDLGYGNFTLGDSGGQYMSYSFYASSEQASSTGAYIELVTTRSNLLDYNRTGVSLLLNNELISSLNFSSETEQISTTRISLLPNVLRRGNNLLEVVSDLRPKDSCYARELQSNWITISESSVIHTPSNSQAVNLTRNINLDNFPYLFLTEDNLGDVAFVLPKGDPISWRQASEIAYFLGNNGNIVISDLVVAYGDDLSEEILKERSLIIVGRASTLPIISQFNESLPAPFEPGGDEAIQPAMLVNYRLLPGVSVGYLQLLPSPWNSERAILTVTGNTVNGIPMAAAALLTGGPASNLQGNFAIIYGDQILATDTRLGPARESIIAELPVAVTVTPQSETESESPAVGQPPAVEGRSVWILPVLALIVILVIGLVVYAVRGQLIGKAVKKEKAALLEEKEEQDIGP